MPELNARMTEVPMRHHQTFVTIILTATLLLLTALFAPADSRAASAEVQLSAGQTVYVPVYSHIYSGPRKQPFQLSATLSIRNTDLQGSFRITAIEYYNNDGRLVRRFTPRPTTLGPLASSHVHIEQNDVSGGFGANFIVRWDADRIINSPIIECVMIGSTVGQGISFVSSGQVIRETMP